MDEYLQRVFDDAYDEAYGHFLSQKQNDPTFDRPFLRGLLNSMYVNQGNDWTGRGQVKDASQDAVIAAAEAILADWEKEN